MTVTADTARELLAIRDGRLFWRPRSIAWFQDTSRYPAERRRDRWNASFAGKEAGSLRPDGYIQVALFNRLHRAHHLVWLIEHGEFPRHMIDHINGDRSDNRPENLRDVERIENNRNMARRRDNASGATGVVWVSSLSKWRARIRVDGRDIHIGLFNEMHEAIEARRAEQLRRGFHANHGRAV